MQNKITLSAISAFIGIAVIFSLWYVFTGISVRNQEKDLRNSFVAVMSSNKVDYDTMWKVISQTAQVPKQYSEDFKNSYKEILSAPSGSDASTVRNLFAVATGMKAPQLDPSLYRKVQDVIESERNKFSNAQKMALAIKKEHDDLRTKFPGSMFVGGVSPLEVQLVTSTRTEEAFSTGKDDNVSVFGKD